MPITWERVRDLFGNPQPPKVVWERQFDYCDEQLRRLARTPYEEIDFSDLWYYYHDLAYAELQPEVFAYLFPVCLMDWHRSLMENETCSRGDAELHFGLRQGDVLEKMATPQQRLGILEFFRDSFSERLDIERGFVGTRNKAPTSAWIQRFNSVGCVTAGIDRFWDALWSLATPGRAVAALEYCSGLMYFDWKNPLYTGWYGIGPCLSASDSWVYSEGWLDGNIQFLREALTLEFVNDRVKTAVACLKGEPEWTQARQLESDLPNCQALIAERVRELPERLREFHGGRSGEWTV